MILSDPKIDLNEASEQQYIEKEGTLSENNDKVASIKNDNLDTSNNIKEGNMINIPKEEKEDKFSEKNILEENSNQEKLTVTDGINLDNKSENQL